MAKTDYTTKNALMGAIPLVKTFFNATMQEMKDLPAADRTQLASAIARTEGFEQNELSFELVAY